MNRRNTKSRLYSHLYRNLLILGPSLGTMYGAMFPAPSYAQDPAIEALMTPEQGEKAGQLGKGELLVNAMKREKVDSASVHKAMSSIGEVFDFRHSRSGDRYVYRLTNGQKLEMLRYQRGAHVYEALLDASTGNYKAEIVDLKKVKLPPSSKEVFAADDDGEVDVEHAAMAGQIQVPEKAETVAHETLNALETATPEDPVLPEDAALAGKPSPDAEFPDAPMPTTDTEAEADIPIVMGDLTEEAENTADVDVVRDGDDLSDDVHSDGDAFADGVQAEGPVVMPTIPKQPNQIAAENTFQNEPYHGPVMQIRQKKPTDTEVSPFSTPFSMISLVMFVLGLVFVLVAFLISALPWLKARRRLDGVGLAIRETLPIAPGHTLACVELDGKSCLIAVHPDTMSFIAPCPLDDEAFWTKLRAKTYWHKMAKKPLSDRQIAALLAEIQKPDTKEAAPKIIESSDIPQLEEEYATAENDFQTEED
ncbi:MAG: hypothetical protein IJU23_02060, partial [Proteobacteria bacterium]|nr:hypothetical protein [Pseudomonadota bacterium]